ncbi:MAG: hypothetical protein GY710_05820 [Desulfobacteraceae bacterium]|nr:hypothetical protein [Desulfobacteraceae bacterium]
MKYILSCFLLLFGSNLFAVQVPQPGKDKIESFQSKVDPAIYKKFRLSDDDSLKSSDPIRIIVYLRQNENIDSDLESKTSGLNNNQVLAQKVKQVQNSFLLLIKQLNFQDKLKSSGFFFDLKMMMDYQYAIVGNVINIKTINKIASLKDVLFIELDKPRKLFILKENL